MLEEYIKKRKFNITTEPKPKKIISKSKQKIFVVQKHAARNLHYDFRLEVDGVLKSFAVPKGIPTKKGKKDLAIQTEDHPLEYAKFKGNIPKGEYGAGHVDIWDSGTYNFIKGSIDRDYLQFELLGDKLKGTYNLVKFNPKGDKKKNMWLIFKSK